MIDKHSLDDYQPGSPRVESIDGDRLGLFVGDDLPAIGSAVAIVDDDTDRRVYAVIERHSGARRAEAWLPISPDWIRPELSIEVTSTPAGIAVPDSKPLVPAPDLLRPVGDSEIPLRPTAPDWSELATARPRLKTGIDPVDVLAPLCEGGLNLVIDSSADDTAFYRLAGRAHDGAAPKQTLLCSEAHLEDTPLSPSSDIWELRPDDSTRSQIASLQIAISLAARLRQTDNALAIIDLPRLRPRGSTQPLAATDTAPAGLPEIIDRLGRHLVSTKNATLTTLLHLRIPAESPGLATIIETLNLGDVDTTIYIDDQGRFDPRRSTSSADFDDEAQQRRRNHLDILQRAEEAREKTAIFGDQELSDAQRDALDKVDDLWAQL